MYCTKCGKEITDGMKFCIACGTPAGSGQTPASQQDAIRPAQPLVNSAVPSATTGTRTQGGRKPMPLGLLAVIALAAVIIAGALVYFFIIAPSSSQQTTTAQSVTTEATSSSGAATATTTGSASAAASTNTTGSVASSGVSVSTGSTSTSGDYVLADSSTRSYNRSELQNMDLHDLYLARNEIYARHGRQFKNADLQQYFNSKSWYKGTIAPESFSDSMLSEVERANANLMLDIEKSRNSPYLG